MDLRPALASSAWPDVGIRGGHHPYPAVENYARGIPILVLLFTVGNYPCNSTRRSNKELPSSSSR